MRLGIEIGTTRASSTGTRLENESAPKEHYLERWVKANQVTVETHKQRAFEAIIDAKASWGRVVCWIG